MKVQQEYPKAEALQLKQLCKTITWVKIALAFDTRKRVAISFGAKLSAIDTTTQPDRTIAKYIITALTVIGMSMAILSPFENIASTAFAAILWIIPQ